MHQDLAEPLAIQLRARRKLEDRHIIRRLTPLNRPLEVLLGMSWLSRVRMDEQDNLLLLERKY